MKEFFENLAKEFAKFNLQQKVAVAVLTLSLPLCLGMGVSSVRSNSGGGSSEALPTPSPTIERTAEPTATPSPTPSPSPTPAPAKKIKLIPASIEEDLEVQIVDASGNLVLNQKFILQVKCAANGYNKKWTVDGDGFLRLPTIPSGKYTVAIEEVEGYIVPEEPVTVEVKKKVEYKEIDVSDQVVDSSQVNEKEEDAAFGTVSTATPPPSKDTVEFVQPTAVPVKTTYTYTAELGEDNRIKDKDGKLTDYVAELKDGKIIKVYKLTYPAVSPAARAVVADRPRMANIEPSPMAMKARRASAFNLKLTNVNLTQEGPQPDVMPIDEPPVTPTCTICSSNEHKTEDPHCTKCSNAYGHTADRVHCPVCGAFECRTKHCDLCDEKHNTDKHPDEAPACKICKQAHATTAHVCDRCKQAGHAESTHPCTHCLENHATAEHPCGVCSGIGHADSTPHCEKCKSIEHAVSAHRCELCSGVHTTANHPADQPKCNYCKGDHAATQHTCETCGVAGHADGTPHCNKCNSIEHTSDKHPDDKPKCNYCNENHAATQHTCETCGAAGHDKTTAHCEKCNSIEHAATAHRCELCSGVHTTANHPADQPKCNYCKENHAATDHTCKTCGGKGHRDDAEHCRTCKKYGHKPEDHCAHCGGMEHTTADHPCKTCGGKGHKDTDAHCKTCGAYGHDDTAAHCETCKKYGHDKSAHKCTLCTDLNHATDKHPDDKPNCKTCGGNHATTNHPKPTKTEITDFFDKDGKINAKYASLNLKITEKTEITYKYTGWQEIDGKRYFFNKDGNKVTGTQTIQGITYYFDSNGVMSTQRVGIDVSKYQGNINWKSVKDAGIEFAIIRVGYRGYGTGKLVWDNYFAQNIKGATDAGLKVGVYIFSQAINTTEAVEEASMCLEGVRGYNLAYPIFFDTEYSTSRKTGRADYLTRDQRTKIAQAFCETVRNAGYKAGIYASSSWFNNQLSYSAISQYEIWVAHYTSAGKPNFSQHYDIWQYTGSGSCAGVPGAVDMNIGYTFY